MRWEEKGGEVGGHMGKVGGGEEGREVRLERRGEPGIVRTTCME